MDFLRGNGPFELGQVKNSKFELAPNQVTHYPPKSPLWQTFIFQIEYGITYLNKQQTPKPDAHVPDAVPPFVPQSSSE